MARIEPGNPQVLAGVVDIAHRAGHTAMAVEHLRRGLELFPGDTMLRQYLANDLSSLQQHAEAGQIWDALVQEQPEQPSLRIGRIKACIARGEPAAA
ncbi:MAG: hypothetical protein J0626_04055, partial [Rhodospirillaceae bacterium]|nr:hypothetical protein [Rhodospirillaceae bacterium]